MPYDVFQVASMLINTQLALGAGAVLEDGVDVFDGAAAAEIVDDIVHELTKLDGESAPGAFGLFAEIDQLALDAVTGGAPLVFFDQGAAVETVALIALVEAVQLYDDGLRERCDGHSLFNLGSDIEHAELESTEHGVRPNVPPDFFCRCRCNLAS